MHLHQVNNSEKHWLVFSVYRPPKAGNLDNFLFALYRTTHKALSKLKNIFIMGDMNIDTLEHSSSLNKLTEHYDTLGLQNLIKLSTCEMKGSSTCIDLILTNCKHNFKHTHAFETGFSDFHKMVTTCFKNTYERLRPINIQYRATRPLTEIHFCQTCRLYLLRKHTL